MRKFALTGRYSNRFPYKIEHIENSRSSRKRAEIFSLIRKSFSRIYYPWILLRGNLDVRVGFVVFEADIILRGVLLYKRIFKAERLDFGRADIVVKICYSLYQFICLEVLFGVLKILCNSLL